MVCFCHKCTCRWGSAQSFLIGIVVKFLLRPVVAAVAGVIRRRRCSRLSVWPAAAADVATAVAATVAHRIVAVPACGVTLWQRRQYTKGMILEILAKKRWMPSCLSSWSGKGEPPSLNSCCCCCYCCGCIQKLLPFKAFHTAKVFLLASIELARAFL